jgi:hypothetical protein
VFIWTPYNVLKSEKKQMIDSEPRLDSFELGTAISQTAGVSFYVDEIMYITCQLEDQS